MKKSLKSLAAFTAIIFTGICAFPQANKTLSNLESPTTINQSLLPNTDNNKNIGSESKSWKNIYLDGSIQLDGNRFITNPAGNIFVGKLAGNTTMTGTRNTVVGNYSGHLLTTGYLNTFIGDSAGYSTTSGIQNTFVGSYSGYANTYGGYNSAFGSQALYSNITGSINSAFGRIALYFNESGVSNSAFGHSALNANISGSQNSAFGTYALNENTEGYFNSAVGSYSLYDNTTGQYNSAVGGLAGSNNLTGNFNTSVGYRAGDSVVSGSNNTCVGAYADIYGVAYTNSTAIGYNSAATASDQIRIGSSSVTSIGGYVEWTNLSDVRFKKNIKENVSGIEFINKLRPVTYNLDLKKINAFIGLTNEESEEVLKISEKEKIVYSGFIAQEVETVAKEIGYDFSGVDAPKNKTDMYGLRYSEFVVPLVRAVQELDSMYSSLQSENEQLKKQIAQLNDAVFGNNINHGTIQHKISDPEFSMPFLDQNIPNPFNNSTIIPFRVPQDCRSASIMIIDISHGKIITVLPVSCEQTYISFEADQLTGGAYTYSLIVDGNVVASKEMVLAK
ncbi:MAG: tail fiber domain-containing protein [Fimbriimonadaceae bacterium]|nr:tail fiber domain-containing protein [Chitinophagales bacterium]